MRTITINKQLAFSRVPLPTFTETTGHNNFKREFIVGSSPDGLVGFKAGGVHVHPDLVREESDMKPGEAAGVIHSSLLRVTEDESLLEWARYNAHMNGPIAICVTNVVRAFQQVGIVGFTEDKTQVSLHVYSDNGSDCNELYFMVRIPYKSAVLEDSSLIEGTERDPLMIFSALIKGEKMPDGTVTTSLVTEYQICLDSRLDPYFEKIEQQIMARAKLDSFIDDIAMNIVNFATNVSGHPTPALSIAAAAASATDPSLEDISSASDNSSSSADSMEAEDLLANIASINPDIDFVINELCQMITSIRSKEATKPITLNNEKYFNKLFEELWSLRQQFNMKPTKINADIKFINALDTLISGWMPVYMEKSREAAEAAAAAAAAAQPAPSIFSSVSALFFSPAAEQAGVKENPQALTEEILQQKRKALEHHVLKLSECREALKEISDGKRKPRIDELDRLNAKILRLEAKIHGKDQDSIELISDVYADEYKSMMTPRGGHK